MDENQHQDQDREEILSVSMTRKELDRVYVVGGIAVGMLFGVMFKVRRHEAQIAQLMKWAGEVTNHLEDAEIDRKMDRRFVTEVVLPIIEKKGA